MGKSDYNINARQRKYKNTLNESRPRREGLLHPHAYQYIMKRDFGGGVKDVPKNLWRAWSNSQKAWDHVCRYWIPDRKCYRADSRGLLLYSEGVELPIGPSGDCTTETVERGRIIM